MQQAVPALHRHLPSMRRPRIAVQAQQAAPARLIHLPPMRRPRIAVRAQQAAPARLIHLPPMRRPRIAVAARQATAAPHRPLRLHRHLGNVQHLPNVPQHKRKARPVRQLLNGSPAQRTHPVQQRLLPLHHHAPALAPLAHRQAPHALLDQDIPPLLVLHKDTQVQHDLPQDAQRQLRIDRKSVAPRR